MNRKHNPWVSLVALLLLVTLLVTVCTGCTEAEAEEEPDRFTVESAQYGIGIDLLIIRDNETGVRYLLAEVNNGGGLTVLQPAPAEEGDDHG